MSYHERYAARLRKFVETWKGAGVLAETAYLAGRKARAEGRRGGWLFSGVLLYPAQRLARLGFVDEAKGMPNRLAVDKWPDKARVSLARRVLTLSLKGEYFDAIKAGTKPEEFRLMTDYWRKRLEDRTYDFIELTKGYPKRDDLSRRLTLPWRGYRTTTLTHPHFGPDPVEVYAINVRL